MQKGGKLVDASRVMLPLPVVVRLKAFGSYTYLMRRIEARIRIWSRGLLPRPLAKVAYGVLISRAYDFFSRLIRSRSRHVCY